jgi:hypothetical protein
MRDEGYGMREKSMRGVKDTGYRILKGAWNGWLRRPAAEVLL